MSSNLYLWTPYNIANIFSIIVSWLINQINTKYYCNNVFDRIFTLPYGTCFNKNN